MTLFSIDEARSHLHLAPLHSAEGNTPILGVSIDTRRIKPGDLFVAVQGEKVDGHDFVQVAEKNGAVAVLVEKPVDSALPTILVKDVRKATGLLARAYRRRFQLPVIGLTGSVGKTTVRALIAHLLRKRYRVLESQGNQNNEWGLPLTLFRLSAQTEVAVLEMGACRVGDIAYLAEIAEPNLGLITRIGTAHMDSFGSQQAIAQGKTELFRAIPASGTLIVNVEDPFLQAYMDSDQALARTRIGVSISAHPLAGVYASDCQLAQDSSTFTLHCGKQTQPVYLPLAGQHNIQNALSAAAVADAMGLTPQAIAEGLATFQSGEAGRLSIKQIAPGTTVIDDSYNASPDAMVAAIGVLAAYPGHRILVMGDMLELGSAGIDSHKQIGHMAKTQGITQLLGLGPLSQSAVQAFGEGGSHFSQQADLIQALLAQLQTIPVPRVILIKGSRGMQMEEVVKALC